MAKITTISRVLWSAVILIHFVLAIVAFINITQAGGFNLPIPTATKLLAAIVTILPVLAILAPAIGSEIRSRTQQQAVGPVLTTDDKAPHRITPLARPVIAILALVDVALISSALTALSPQTLDCGLSVTWGELFSSKDATALRTIQDTLQCCGFGTVRDRGFPFPDSTHNADACVAATGYQRPCAPRLRQQEQQTLGTFVAVGAFALAVKAVLSIFTMQSAGLRGNGQPVWKSKAKAILPIDDEDNENREGSSRAAETSEEGRA